MPQYLFSIMLESILKGKIRRKLLRKKLSKIKIYQNLWLLIMLKEKLVFIIENIRMHQTVTRLKLHFLGNKQTQEPQ